MQVKFANRESSKQTGQIKSISKYEMLYIPKSISANKRINLEERIIELANVNVSDFNGSGLCYENNEQAVNNKRIRLDSASAISQRVSRILVTLVVFLCWITSISCMHDGNNVINVFYINESTTSQQIKWPTSMPQNVHMKSMASIPLSSQSSALQPLPSLSSMPASSAVPSIKSSSFHAIQMAVHRERRRRHTLSSMLTLNVLKRDKANVADHVANANGLDERHQKRQQFGISIITSSKKTNPNASFSLDLFTHTGNVQKHNSTTLNSLAHESNRIPDAIRESLHHHHSVIKRFRAFVTKRYHFMAAAKNQSSISMQTTQIKSNSNDAMPNKPVTFTTDDRPIEPPLKHLIYVLTTVDQASKRAELNQRIHGIAHKQMPIQNTPNRPNLFDVINRTKLLLQNLHPKRFDHQTSITAIETGHSNHKRSIDLQRQSPQPTTTTPQTPFDDHFFNSKLQNYYFLYQIDNISNYNNHFDLLNSPNNYNATQIQINQQRIQFSNRQIDNALIDATKSDFLQYNPYKLNLNNKPSNHIKRILFAKIASMCLNCVDGTEPPVKIYVLSRLIPITDLNHSIPDAVVQPQRNGTQDGDEKHMNRMKRVIFQLDSSLSNSLKNYPRIADLLGNLSLAEHSAPENYENSKIFANKLHVIIDQYDDPKNRSKHEMATRLTLIDANATHSFHAFSKSLKINNLPNNYVKAMVAPAQRRTITSPISNSNSSPISTFEHYIRIISSRNINKRNNYAIQTNTTTTTTKTTNTNGNTMKSFNFQQQQQQLMKKFKRVKKRQQQIIKLINTNHRFIHNDTNDNNINGNGNVAGQINDTNNVRNFEQNVTNNEHNFTINENRQTRSKSGQRPTVHSDHQMDENMAAKAETVPTSMKTDANNPMESIEIIKAKKVKRNERVIMAQHQQSQNNKSRKSNTLNSYLMRLESIKYQILMKLGLKQKPNITNTLPKHVIMETLYRAQDSPQSNGNSRKHPHRKQHRPKQLHKPNKHHSKHNKANKAKAMPTASLNDDPSQQVYQFESHRIPDNIDKDNNSNSAEDKFPFNADLFEESNDVESDDFYGRTREIIIFAEKGSYFNHQPLIEFVSTNGLDESITSVSVKSDAVAIPFNRTAQVNDDKLKQRPKCNRDIIESRQVRKRKRRRRQAFESMDTQKNVRSKPVILVSNQNHAHTETVGKFPSSSPSFSSSLSSSTVENYQSSEFENHSDTRVRRAFLWIKVDESTKKKKNHGLPKTSTNNPKMKSKMSGKRHRNTFPNFFRLWVFRIVEPNSESNQQIKLSASKSVHVSRLGWQKLDVTSTVRQWYASDGKMRLRFLVDCSGCVDRFKIHLFDSKPTKSVNARAKPNLLQNDKFNASTDPVRPFLVIYTDPHLIKRVRRHTPDCSVAVRGQCCKQKFYVSFAELGWEDWIIAPHGYYANYCQGNCNGLRTPDNFRSYHSHVIEEYRKMNRLTGLQPCCTPLKFSSMSLIYYEENQKIIKRDLPKMVVDECGCP